MDVSDPILPLWAMELMLAVFVYAWLFCLGATVGSFLNVVVYRLPRGRNLAYPGSFCPRCGHSIRLTDNIPILSWLVLRGRCRDCGGRISLRYFFVELVVAAVFLMVLAGEHFLPAVGLGFAVREPLTARDGAAFWCMYAVHVVLVTTLIGAALLRADGAGVPATLFLPILVIGFVLPLIWPEIRSVPTLGDREWSNWHDGLIDGLFGLLMGFVLGAAASVVARWKEWPVGAVVAMGCCVGVVLGWQRTILWFPVALLGCHWVAYVVGFFTTPQDATEAGTEVAAAESMDTLEEFASTPPPQSHDPP